MNKDWMQVYLRQGWTGWIEYSNNDISRIGQQNERDKRLQSTEVGEQGFRPNEGSGEVTLRLALSLFSQK